VIGAAPKYPIKPIIFPGEDQPFPAFSFDLPGLERGGAIDASAINVTNINAGNITTGTLDADRIGALSITAGKLAANAVESAKIKAGAVTATKISVSTLSAITANIGSVTAGTITGVLIRTSVSGQRVRITNDRVEFYGSGGEYAYMYVGAGGYLRIGDPCGCTLFSPTVSGNLHFGADDYVSFNESNNIWTWVADGVTKYAEHYFAVMRFKKDLGYTPALEGSMWYETGGGNYDFRTQLEVGGIWRIDQTDI